MALAPYARKRRGRGAGAQARVQRDGQVYEGWRVSGEERIELKAKVQDHVYLVMHA